MLLDPPSKVQCKRDIIYMQRLFGLLFFLLLFFFCSYEIRVHGMVALCRMCTHRWALLLGPGRGRLCYTTLTMPCSALFFQSCVFSVISSRETGFCRSRALSVPRASGWLCSAAKSERPERSEGPWGPSPGGPPLTCRVWALEGAVGALCWAPPPLGPQLHGPASSPKVGESPMPRGLRAPLPFLPEGLWARPSRLPGHQQLEPPPRQLRGQSRGGGGRRLVAPASVLGGLVRGARDRLRARSCCSVSLQEKGDRSRWLLAPCV